MGEQSSVVPTRTPLHEAVESIQVETVLELLQKGHDANALDEHYRTPLYYALTMHDDGEEIVCMLLYYGADVLVADDEDDTPIAYAFKQYHGLLVGNINNLHESVKILLDYFDTDFYKSASGVRTFLTVTEHFCSIGIDMVKSGGGVNSNTKDFGQGFCLQMAALCHSLKYDTAELFKLLWPNLNHSELVVKLPGFIAPPEFGLDTYFHWDEAPIPILTYYLQFTFFYGPEWIECLYLLLDSPFSMQLVENCLNFRPLHRRPNEHYFIQDLVDALHKNDVELDDRVCIIYTCLSLGASVNYYEFNSVFQMYGFGEELEALLYGVKSYNVILQSAARFLLLPMYILGCETTYKPRFIYKLYKREVKQHRFKERCGYYLSYTMSSFDKLQESKYLLNSLGYFSLSENLSYKLRDSARHYLKNSEEICLKLDKIPTVPSLLELSRNVFRLHLKNVYQFKYPYQFHDCVKRLKVPEVIKDVIRFKRCIYG